MIILTETTDALQIVLDSAITTSQLQCFTCYRDVSTPAFTPKRNGVNTNNTSDVNLIASPSSGAQHIIDFISVYNRDTAAATVTIKLDANGTEYIIWKGILRPQERLEYSDKDGFSVYNNQGARKISSSAGVIAVGETQTIVLASDVVNNNATANTLQDLTGLIFSTVAGETYRFRLFCAYISAISTTGSRWTVTASGLSEIYYRANYPLTGTTESLNYSNAIQLPATSNGTSITAGGVSEIVGVCKASSDGTVQAQFASEISSSAITAKGGMSFLEYSRLT